MDARKVVRGDSIDGEYREANQYLLFAGVMPEKIRLILPKPEQSSKIMIVLNSLLSETIDYLIILLAIDLIIRFRIRIYCFVR